MCIRFFIIGNISYRGCSKVCSLLAEFYLIACPHYTTIRNWVLRVGYYELNRAKGFRADWVFIVDYTIGISNKKCLIILGISLEKLRKDGFNLSLTDIEVLHLEVTQKAKWHVTYNALIETSRKVGVPSEIISDYGADVKRGIEEFCQENPAINYVYDITHMIACLLRGILQTDTRWVEFTDKAQRCKHQTVQTILSFLSPPSQRAKARYLNIESLINWAKQILKYGDKKDYSQIFIDMSLQKKGENNNSKLSYPDDFINRECEKMFKERFGWVNEFRTEISQYNQYIEIVKIAKQYIALEGLSRKSIKEVDKQLRVLTLNEKAKGLCKKLICKLKENIPQKAKYKETFLGTSDIIESLFGKYKYFNAEGSMMGITQSILLMAAATVKLEMSNIKQALEYCNTEKINDWSKRNIGESIFAKRKKMMGCNFMT